jgi:chromosome segregation ATPase
MYSKTMEQTQAQLDDGQKEQKSLENQITKSNKDMHRVATKTQQTEMDIMSEVQAQAGIEKQKGGTVRDATKLKNQIFEKEVELTNMENEIANMKVEILQSEDKLDEFKQQLTEIEELISGENQLIGNYELSLRKTFDEMTKKQSEMDMLNRRYDHLVAQNAAADGAMQGEIGPLEATISSLNKNIKQSDKEILDLQQKWLRSQTELVVLTKNMEELRAAIEEAKTRRTVLERKKIVINGAFERATNDIKTLERDIRKVRSDMEKVNFLLAKQNMVEQELKENNLGLEIVFKNRLKEAEHESIRVEKMIEKIKEEKEQALNDLIDVE